jgi:predicted nucleic acid-binding protein
VLLLDNSAWARIVEGALDEDLRAKVASWLDARQIATCLPFVLEAGYSARSGAHHEAMMSDLDRLPHIAITADVERRAREAQAELAKIGHHRMPPIDVILAACAEEASAGVLHYDRDYDVLAEKSGLQFESVWLAPPGSL